MADMRYRTNGTGRDTYIGMDNGGNNHMYSPAGNKDPPMRFLPKLARSPSNQLANINQVSKPIHYQSDGSGRDGYVCTGDGGFTNSGSRNQIGLDSRVAFKQSLRGYSQITDYLSRRNYDSKNMNKIGKIRISPTRNTQAYTNIIGGGVSRHQSELTSPQRDFRKVNNPEEQGVRDVVAMFDRHMATEKKTLQPLQTDLQGSLRSPRWGRTENSLSPSTKRLRAYPNSIAPTNGTTQLLARPPKMPAQNIQHTHVQRMAKYQRGLEARLSVPKLTSPTHKTKMTKIQLKKKTMQTGRHSLVDTKKLIPRDNDDYYYDEQPQGRTLGGSDEAAQEQSPGLRSGFSPMIQI